MKSSFMNWVSAPFFGTAITFLLVFVPATTFRQTSQRPSSNASPKRSRCVLQLSRTQGIGTYSCEKWKSNRGGERESGAPDNYFGPRRTGVARQKLKHENIFHWLLVFKRKHLWFSLIQFASSASLPTALKKVNIWRKLRWAKETHSVIIPSIWWMLNDD